MASVIASESDQSGHELKLCDACTRDNRTISATKWCRDCRESLCEPCSRAHKTNKLSVKHGIISLDDVTEREFAAGKLDFDSFCKSHKNELLKLYCKSHKSFCCTLCAFSSHEECKKLIPLDDIAKMCTDQKLLQKQTTAFTETKTKVQKAIAEKSSYLQNLDCDKLSVLSQASDLLRKTKKKLDQLYAEFERNVVREHKQIKQSQEKMMTVLLEFQKQVECSTAMLQTLQHVTPVESLIMMETLKANIVQPYENVEEKLKQDSNIQITFKPDHSLNTIVAKLSSIGEIAKQPYCTVSSEDVFSINKIKNGLDIGTMIGTPAQYPILSRKDLTTARLNLVKVITREDLNIGGNLWFTDNKFMDNGQLLLVDYSGNRLVLLNENMKVTTEIKVNANPSCVDIGDDGGMATVVCNEGSVQHYSLQGGQEQGRWMDVENGAWGIAVTGDTTIIGHQNNKVAFYDNKGNMMKSTPTRSVFPYIAVSNDGQQIYYSDDDTVVACDKQLNVKWRYKCDNLRVPCGICVDPYDNVYVVGHTSNNIHQISRDGTRHKVLLQQMNKITNHWAIAFHKSRDMFVVTSYELNGPLEMYEFLR